MGGSTLETYLEAVRRLEGCDYDILELNISCPNVKAGGMAFGTEAKSAQRITQAVRMQTQKRLMVKLSPNVSNIGEIAKACEAGGADAISLINTVQAMAIDTKSRQIVFNNTYAGLSGPAIRPIALRMVHQTAKATNLPIVGMGGITSADEVIQFMMAGASAVQIGTAFFTKPERNLSNPCTIGGVDGERRRSLTIGNYRDCLRRKIMSEIKNILKETEAFLEGHFLLSSGRHSGEYVQCAKVLRFPDKGGGGIEAGCRPAE